jgi:acetate kinase
MSALHGQLQRIGLPETTLSWRTPDNSSTERRLDARNEAHAAVISTDASAVTVRVMPTDEELMIARSVSRVLAPGGTDGM